MKIILICNTDGALYIFRNPLIRALVAAGHEVVSICPEGEYTERLRAMGVRIHPVEFGRHSVSPLQNLGLFFRILRIVRAERPDVMHGFTHKPVIYGSLAARLARVPRIVMTVTGLGTLFIRNDALARLLRQALIAQYRMAVSRRVAVLFQNPDDLAEMVGLRAVRREQALLSNGSGIDLDEFPVPKPAEAAQMRDALCRETGCDLNDRIIVLFPARGVREKGFLEYYEAARRIGEAAPGRYVFLHLGLIDTASSGHFSAENVRAFAIDHGVHYLGFKENIRDYMAASDIVMLPSYREGVPRSLIEALALGKTVIATDVPGCRETVIDGWNGYLCAPRSAESLVEALLKVDRAMIERVAPLSRRYCEKKFDVKLLNRKTFGLYGLATSQSPEI